MKKEMLINVLQPEECRIAIVEDGVLEELYDERTSQESYVGNIYKGRVVNIEPSIQGAFVDFGIGRNGFLHVSDVEPAYYRHLEQRRGDNGPSRGSWTRRSAGRRRKMPRRPRWSPRPATRMKSSSSRGRREPRSRCRSRSPTGKQRSRPSSRSYPLRKRRIQPPSRRNRNWSKTNAPTNWKSAFRILMRIWTRCRAGGHARSAAVAGVVAP